MANHNPEAALHPEVQQKMRRLSSRDLQLWLLALLVLLVTVGGVVAIVLPNISWNSASLRVESRYLPQVLFGLVGLVILFNLYVLQQRRELNHAREQLIRSLVEKERSEVAPLVDPLTRVFTRRYLELLLPKEVSRSKRTGSSLSLLLADVTDLASINLSQGDAAGDRCLAEVAQLMEATFRVSDTVVRYSADQFLVIMPETAEDQAERALERLSEALAARHQASPASYPVALGCGMATYREGADINDVLRIAEHNLRGQQARARSHRARGREMQPQCLLTCSDAGVLGVLRPMLESLGVAVDLCTRAEECLELLGQRKFDAVVVDAGEKGERLDLVGRIRRLPAGRHTLLCCAVDAGRQEAAYRLGANLVLSKPLSPDLVKGNLRVAYGLMVGEQQRYFRQAVEMAVQLRYGKGMETQVTSSSMSEGGMVVRISMPVEAGQKVIVRFQPAGILAIEGQAEIAWCDQEGRAGIRFTQLPAPARVALERWLAAAAREESKPQSAAGKPQAAPGAPVRQKIAA
ncbi:MAG TPA: diguanylate cyclase [Terriglobales bacterium]|jgi:diguanylate cyclase (GGDEF)-like protein|nr:diguanylate cyclase [Terriglobales bacterium]